MLVVGVGKEFGLAQQTACRRADGGRDRPRLEAEALGVCFLSVRVGLRSKQANLTGTRVLPRPDSCVRDVNHPEPRSGVLTIRFAFLDWLEASLRPLGGSSARHTIR